MIAYGAGMSDIHSPTPAEAVVALLSDEYEAALVRNDLAAMNDAVSYTHLTLPTNREV